MRFLLVSFSLAFVVTQVTAWNELTHRTVALVAKSYLSKDALKYYERFLPGEEFSDLAVWANSIENERPWTREWHYTGTRNVKANSIVTSITHNSLVFLSRNKQTLIQRQEALKYLLHLIADIHQPLHVSSSYRGGKQIQICFRRKCAGNSLHEIWDTDIPNKICDIDPSSSPSAIGLRIVAREWADRLLAMNRRSGLAFKASKEEVDLGDLERCLESWVEEGREVAESFAWKVQEGEDFSQEYFEGVKGPVEERVLRAGVRLGGYLNSLWERIRDGNALEKEVNGEKVAWKGNVEVR